LTPGPGPPNVRTPHAARARRGAPLEWGPRRPGPEPNGRRETVPSLAAANDHAGSGSRTVRCSTTLEGALNRPRDPLPTRVQDLPPLPETYHATLDDGLRAIGLALDGAARSALDGHVRLLLAWTTAINLTAIRDPAEVARLHVLDSVAAVDLLRARGADRVLDLGSGGGFPGLPLAIALPASRTLLVDSVGKKVAFLDAVIGALGLSGRVEAIASRSEPLAHGHDRGSWPVVTARAVASIAQLVEIGLPLVAPGGVLVAWKRGPVDAELRAAGPALATLRAGTVEVVPEPVPGLGDHRLIVIPRGGPIDGRFPRDPGERRRHPLGPADLGAR
jgi:16S rRNA (guanine527-N7)-methyltransferase